jgi:hypothetical protein
VAKSGHDLVQGRGRRVADGVVDDRAVDDGADLTRRHVAGQVQGREGRVEIGRGVDRGVPDARQGLRQPQRGGQVAGIATDDSVAERDVMSSRRTADGKLELAAHDRGAHAHRPARIGGLELRLQGARQTVEDTLEGGCGRIPYRHLNRRTVHCQSHIAGGDGRRQVGVVEG